MILSNFTVFLHVIDKKSIMEVNMKLGQQLKIKQNQSLIMTPQLQQAIKLLQLSNIELSEFIDNAQLENPFLQEKKRIN